MASSRLTRACFYASIIHVKMILENNSVPSCRESFGVSRESLGARIWGAVNCCVAVGYEGAHSCGLVSGQGVAGFNLVRVCLGKDDEVGTPRLSGKALW